MVVEVGFVGLARITEDGSWIVGVGYAVREEESVRCLCVVVEDALLGVGPSESPLWITSAEGVAIRITDLCRFHAILVICSALGTGNGILQAMRSLARCSLRLIWAEVSFRLDKAPMPGLRLCKLCQRRSSLPYINPSAIVSATFPQQEQCGMLAEYHN